MEKTHVDVWTIPLGSPSPSYLSPDEVERANRFKFEKDRVRWTRARSALRLVLSRYAGEDPVRLTFTYGKHGKPALPFTDVEFNLSHSGDWAMIAVTRAIQVGVDIEQIRANIEMAPLLERLGETDLSGTPRQLFQVWTRREAKTKAAGGALFDQPGDDISVTDLEAPEGYAASLALVDGEPSIHYCGNGKR